VGIEHQNCVPGATPTFHIDFTNPLNAPVPKNPADPNGGYYFRAELIANGKYFVDAVPIYVIPEDLSGMGPPAVPQLPATGTYWQDLPAKGCTGNTSPDWRDLTWNADIPAGTSVGFDVCTASTLVGLDSCAFTHIATAVGGGTCASDAECVGGLCASNGVCVAISGTACSVDLDCLSGGATCVAGACSLPGQPVYVGQALGNLSANFQPFLRMKITLAANTTANTGPTVYDWALTYICGTTL
jgi:hypothetical protein